MGYGIQITGADGTNNANTFIVQDSDLNMINYQVTGSGVASSVPQSSTVGARLFVNGNVSGTQGQFVASLVANSAYNFYKLNYTQSGGIGQEITNVSLTSTNVNYVILKKMTSISNSGNNYGVQLITNTGAVAFDSRRIVTNNRFVFTETRATGTMSGNNGEISQDGDSYIDVGTLYSLVVQNSAEDTASTVQWNGSGTGVGRVKYLSFFNINIMGGNTTAYFSNFTTMILGKIA